MNNENICTQAPSLGVTGARAGKPWEKPIESKVLNGPIMHLNILYKHKEVLQRKAVSIVQASKNVLTFSKDCL